MDAVDVIKFMHRRIDQLEEALRFYANEKHYDTKLRPSSMGDYEWSEVTDDLGSYARAVLGENYDRHKNQTTEA